jgi:phenylpropionate dioxygenase-like ring-hydroxylating dioxygenase large terminal subunit
VRAAFDECPHRAARLSQGWVDGDGIVCPYHGWRFDRTGACVEIPAAEPGVPVPPRAHLATVRTEERYGLVWVCIGTPRTGLPVLGEADDPAFTLIHELLEVWDVSAPRIIDNALDVGHVAAHHARRTPRSVRLQGCARVPLRAGRTGGRVGHPAP